MKKGTIHNLFKHFFTNHQDELIPAMAEFFDDKSIGPGTDLRLQNEQEEGLFMEWIAFDFRLRNGQKLIEDFIATNPFKLSTEALTVYHDLEMNKYGMYEIIKVERDKYIDLESLQSGKIYRVIEKSGTNRAKPKTTWFCRVGKVGDHWELIGSDPIGYPVFHTERMKALIRQDKTAMSPKDTRALLNQHNDRPSKFEKNLTMSPESLEQEKTRIKNALIKQLSKTNSKSTLEEILAIIYNARGRAVADTTLRIASMLSDSSAIPAQRIIDLVTDAWNHFPHKSLGDLSPAEKAQEVYGESRENFRSNDEIGSTRTEELGLPAGAFLPLFVIVPDLDEEEIKSIILSHEKYGLASGVYYLIENYCADRECDCRKAMINVVDDKNKIWATIGYGWESTKYYEKWIDDKELARQMTGIYQEVGGIQTDRTDGCLKLVKKALEDPYYINCLRRHYKQFKTAL